MVVFQVVVFWVVMQCSTVVEYHPLKCWYPTIALHGITTQKTCKFFVGWVLGAVFSKKKLILLLKGLTASRGNSLET
jgi:hypothetical protein